MSAAGNPLALALLMELLVGDPVSQWHPVALFGRWISWAMGRAPGSGPGRQLAFGTALVTIGVGGVGLGSEAFLRWLRRRSPRVWLLVASVLLKASFSYRQLEREAWTVSAYLDRGDLPAAREALHALVGRETRSLSAPLVAAAVVESVAENLSDSLVAPLLAYAALGIPGALAYRAINTLDAMVGYHGDYEYLGRVAARLDDLANLVPARATALLLVLGAGLAGEHPSGAARIALREHGRTESPNAGWPMAAMAGALQVRLEKSGHYLLGTSFDECQPAVIARALRVARWVAGLAAAGALLVTWKHTGTTHRWTEA
jgi:adenosylcobinamide-phosphate synthase